MNPVYASFAGGLDQAATGRLFNAYSIASQKQVPEIHLLFQTTRGNVSEGVVLYNFIRNFPIPTSIYNGGGVNSAGVILFCGAQHRYASAHATFLIHSTYLGNVSAAHSGTLYGLADSIALDDERTTAILREHLKLPDESWVAHRSNRDVSFGARQALEYGLIHEIREFVPPAGTQVFNL
jgi:ATP-dependent protease ClpP protease subunit